MPIHSPKQHTMVKKESKLSNAILAAAALCNFNEMADKLVSVAMSVEFSAMLIHSPWKLCSRCNYRKQNTTVKVWIVIVECDTGCYCPLPFKRDDRWHDISSYEQSHANQLTMEALLSLLLQKAAYYCKSMSRNYRMRYWLLLPSAIQTRWQMTWYQ